LNLAVYWGKSCENWPAFGELRSSVNEVAAFSEFDCDARDARIRIGAYSVNGPSNFHVSNA